MAHPNPFVREIASLLDDNRVLSTAREAGFLVRQRDLQVVPFFWTLVLGMIASPLKTLSGLQRLYHQTTGTVLASSSFQGRFTPALVAWLRATFEHAASGMCEKRRDLAGVLGAFHEITLIDSTLLRLHKLLAGRYPGPRTNHSPAAMKLNVVYNVRAGRIQTATVAEGTRAEPRFFKPGPWMAGSLLLFDLGYFKLQNFHRIAYHGGYFISRLKDSCNPTITRVLSVHRGRAIDLAGKKLKEVLGSLKREVLDCEIEYRLSRKGLPGRPSTEKTIVLKLRLVAVLNKEAGRYHLYVTNVSPDMLAATDVAESYAARWIVEQLFKECRSIGGIDAWPNRKEEVALAGIYATLLGMVVNRRLLAALKDRLAATEAGQGRRIATLRWTRVFASHALAFLELVLGNLKQNHQEVKTFVSMLLREAMEPKRLKPRMEAKLAL